MYILTIYDGTTVVYIPRYIIVQKKNNIILLLNVNCFMILYVLCKMFSFIIKSENSNTF